MSARRVTGQVFRSPGQELSWAGYCPWTDNWCFGTEGGAFILPPTGLKLPADRVPCRAIFKDEAINGVAFSEDLLAISSRSEVIIFKRTSPDGAKLVPLEPSYKGGAHGIVADPSGRFIAPLGSGGLLFIGYTGGQLDMKVVEGSPNFYRLAFLGSCDHGEVFGCAARKSGLLAVTVRDGSVRSPIVGHQFTGIDTIDVCSLRSSTAPLAAAALNLDNSLLLTRNILEQKEPLTLRFDGLKGIAYSLLCAQGHIFVLTSDELVVFSDLAADFLRGEPMDVERNLSPMSIQAADAFPGGDGTLFLIEGDEAVGFKISDLVASAIDALGSKVLSNGDSVVIHDIDSAFEKPSVLSHAWSTTQPKIIPKVA